MSAFGSDEYVCGRPPGEVSCSPGTRRSGEANAGAQDLEGAPVSDVTMSLPARSLGVESVGGEQRG